VIHPARNNHTISTIGDNSTEYLCIRYSARSVAKAIDESGVPVPLKPGQRARTQVVTPTARTLAPSGSKRIREVLFDAPTVGLRTLHIHSTVTPPGGGYDPHRDKYDVVILVLAGSLRLHSGSIQNMSHLAGRVTPERASHSPPPYTTTCVLRTLGIGGHLMA
jgi:hypothetical protein